MSIAGRKGAANATPRSRPSSSGSKSMSLSRTQPSQSSRQTRRHRSSRSSSARRRTRSPAELVASLGRPGGNVTGLSVQFTDLAGKQLELLREVVPGLRRLAIMLDIGNSGAVLEMGKVQTAARILGVERLTLEIRRAEDIAPAFETLKGRAEALYVCSDPLAHRKAGYSPTAIGGPNRLLDQPRIRAAIEELELRKAAEAGVRLGAVLNATVKIAFANLADFVECDEDGNMKINEDGQPQLRPGLTREDLEAVSTITVNDRGKVSWVIDRQPALKALRDLLHPLKTKVELTGPDGAPLFDPSKLSDDDLASLIRILEGAITGSSGAGQGGGGSED